jgi:hypothetical protein
MDVEHASAEEVRFGDGRLVVGIFADIAEFERGLIRDRVKSGIAPRLALREIAALRLRFAALGQQHGQPAKKKGAPAWDREPRKARFVASVVFTPACGVIHPSFPLRGRWERIVESNEQAPSPSLRYLRSNPSIRNAPTH